MGGVLLSNEKFTECLMNIHVNLNLDLTVM